MKLSASLLRSGRGNAPRLLDSTAHARISLRACIRTCMYVARVMELSKFLREKLPTPAVGDAPHQPLSFKFRWPWLHYSEESDTAYRCIIAYSEGKIAVCGRYIESTYISITGRMQL